MNSGVVGVGGGVMGGMVGGSMNSGVVGVGGGVMGGSTVVAPAGGSSTVSAGLGGSTTTLPGSVAVLPASVTSLEVLGVPTTVAVDDRMVGGSMNSGAVGVGGGVMGGSTVVAPV